MTGGDWPRVEQIFAVGIAGGEATLEIATPSWAEFDAAKIPEPRLVAIDSAGDVIGWSAASRVSTRAAYRGVLEHSVYVAPEHRGQGVGRPSSAGS